MLWKVRSRVGGRTGHARDALESRPDLVFVSRPRQRALGACPLPAPELGTWVDFEKPGQPGKMVCYGRERGEP